MSTTGSEVLSPATLARIEFTCDMLGLKGNERDLVAKLCQMSRVEGHIDGIEEARAIVRGKRDNVVHLDIEKIARIYDGRPSDSEGPEAA